MNINVLNQYSVFSFIQSSKPTHQSIYYAEGRVNGPPSNRARSDMPGNVLYKWIYITYIMNIIVSLY